MTDSYRGEILGMMWSNLQSALSALHPGELPAPEDDAATATDLTVMDEAATGTDLTAEPMVVPAVETAP